VSPHVIGFFASVPTKPEIASELDCIRYRALKAPAWRFFGKRGDCSKFVKFFDGSIPQLSTVGDNPFRKLPTAASLEPIDSRVGPPPAGFSICPAMATDGLTPPQLPEHR
jgi:hypothetical protein